MIVGLHGRAGSGKDTVCDFIRVWGEATGNVVRREAFADRLKLSAARLFFPELCLEDAIAWCNQLKEGGKVTVTGVDVESAVSGREFLQHYGTESHREVFGTDFWVEAALEQGRNEDFLVVTDVRFPNEAAAIRARGGEVWQVLRAGHAINEHDHVSERPLAPNQIDQRIVNDGSLEDLLWSVRFQMERIFLATLSA